MSQGSAHRLRPPTPQDRHPPETTWVASASMDFPVCDRLPPRLNTSARYLSPLRYPGGKSRMARYLAEMFINQPSVMDVEVFIEPFAGGAGVGLALVDSGVVDELWLMDLNPSLAAFWRTVLRDGDAFADRVETSEASMVRWDTSRELVAAAETGEVIDDWDLAFAGFFINRCSRSGICSPTAGPMGGRHQSGRWTIGARYNPAALAARIRHVAAMSSRITFHEFDGIDYVAGLDGSVGFEDEVMILADPPYLREGPRLYARSFDLTEHRRLAAALTGSPTRWVLTYDDEPRVHEELYPQHRVLQFSIANSANRRRIAHEYAVFSDLTGVDRTAIPLPDGTAEWIRWDDEDETPDLEVPRLLLRNDLGSAKR